MAKFQTTILTAGKTATGICVPDDIIEKLGSGKKPPVKITLNGYTYSSTVAVMGGKFMVPVSAAVREAAGVAGGDKLTVEIELDTEERKISIPPALKKALDENPKAKHFFETLSYSKQRVHTDAIATAKTPETLQRRIIKSIGDLASGKK
jgi:hypothetical protein